MQKTFLLDCRVLLFLFVAGLISQLSLILNKTDIKTIMYFISSLSLAAGNLAEGQNISADDPAIGDISLGLMTIA